jgi:hypothetical protein
MNRRRLVERDHTRVRTVRSVPTTQTENNLQRSTTKVPLARLLQQLRKLFCVKLCRTVYQNNFRTSHPNRFTPSRDSRSPERFGRGEAAKGQLRPSRCGACPQWGPWGGGGREQGEPEAAGSLQGRGGYRRRMSRPCRGGG